MAAKFKVRDKVRFNRDCHPRHQVPQNVACDLRERTRTIIDTYYCPRRRRIFYELGGPGKSRLPYCFTSHQLVKVNGTPVRPMTSTTDGEQGEAVKSGATTRTPAQNRHRVRLASIVARFFGW